MSLRIDVGKVRAVMIRGQWYDVWDESFMIDTYEFVESEGYGSPLMGDELGFAFIEKNRETEVAIAGPMHRIDAVRYAAE